MPIVAIPYIFCALGALVGIGGYAHGADQHKKRKKGQKLYRKTLKRLKQHMGEKEAELVYLGIRLGDKCDQVRKLAREIARLREVIAGMEMHPRYHAAHAPRYAE